MIPKEVIAIIAIVVIIGSALIYIIRARKKGVKCIGCSECNCNCNKNSCNYYNESEQSSEQTN